MSKKLIVADSRAERERKDKKARWYVIGILTGLFLLATIWVLAAREADRGLLKVVFLDVGQGSAAYINSPYDTEIVVDAGFGTGVLRRLSAYRPFWDRSLDYVVPTHPDADHIGGMPELFDQFDIEHMLATTKTADNGLYAALVDRAESEGVSISYPTVGQSIVFGDGVELFFFWPESADLESMERNTSSLVFKLAYGDVSFLFMGDAPARVERYLARRYGPLLGSDVLVVGHHGSKTSTDPEFVAAVEPTYAVISAGADNRYGHPHEVVLETLTAAGVHILRTDQVGDIEFVSDGRVLELRAK